MAPSTTAQGLKGRHLLDVSGAILGDPVFELAAIDGAQQRSEPALSVTSSDHDGVVGRCVSRLLDDMATIRPPNASILFLRDGKDFYLLHVRWDETAAGAERPHRIRLLILEPLSTSSVRRTVGLATAERHADSGGITYEIRLLIHASDDAKYAPSYEHLLLVNKVLSRLGRPPHDGTEGGSAWIG